MEVTSTLFCFLLTITIVVSIHIHSHGQISRIARKGDPEDRREVLTMIQQRQQRSNRLQEDEECQSGYPLGVTYSGRMNVTESGRTCQAWSASEPHEHDYTENGDHNYCRNSYGDDGGVWCFTTDPNQRWEFCRVPRCLLKMVKLLDFSTDNDHKPDSNDEYTSAT